MLKARLLKGPGHVQLFSNVVGGPVIQVGVNVSNA